MGGGVGIIGPHHLSLSHQAWILSFNASLHFFLPKLSFPISTEFINSTSFKDYMERDLGVHSLFLLVYRESTVLEKLKYSVDDIMMLRWINLTTRGSSPFPY